MKTAASPIRFAGSHLAQPRHVCAFFHNADEEYRVLLPLIKDGFEYGFLSELRERRAAQAGPAAV